MDLSAVIAAAFAAAEFDAVPLEPSSRPRLEGGRLVVPPAALAAAAEEAARRAAFYLRPSQLRLMAGVLADPEASANDRWVVRTLLDNAAVAARGELALCQDTGTATLVAWKDEGVASGGRDAAAFEAGIAAAYRKHHLRSSQVGATAFFEEFDTGDNLPAQIHIEAADGRAGTEAAGPSYRFLFIAKGAGSSNKTSLFPMTKALLEPAAFERFLAEKVAALGVAACPPYRLALVVGGTSPEENLSVLKLAGAELLDAAPAYVPGETEKDSRLAGWIRRDRYWEERLMAIARASGLGAQFGGIGLALDARAIRLPRHAGACPVSLGVSCSAHRNVLAVLDSNGLRVERLAVDPEAVVREAAAAAPPAGLETAAAGDFVDLDLDRPWAETRSVLSGLAVGSRLRLSGRLLVARDAAHLKWHESIALGRSLPDYLTRYPIYYAGPSAAPPGKAIGSFGPTTAQRMDGYADELMSRGAARLTLAKGNRAQAWTDACAAYGGFFLATVGGAAALLAERNILESRVLDYPELGMEAVRLIRVSGLEACLVIDDKGNELYRR
jgi:fumarate hydratase class I